MFSKFIQIGACGLIFLLWGCSKELKVDWIENNPQIKDFSFDILELEDVSWHIFDKNKEAYLSKGFKAKVEVPIFPELDAKRLFEKWGITSFVVKIERFDSPEGNSILGYFHLPFYRPVENSRGVRNRGKKMATGAYFQVYYAASAPSLRFEGFKCPAFDHRLKIDQLEFTNSGASSSSNFTPSFEGKISGKVSLVELKPVQFGQGVTLKGRYVVSVALFNGETQEVYGPWIAAPQSIILSKEKNIHIPWCNNFEIPERKNQKTKTFRFSN